MRGSMARINDALRTVDGRFTIRSAIGASHHVVTWPRITSGGIQHQMKLTVARSEWAVRCLGRSFASPSINSGPLCRSELLSSVCSLTADPLDLSRTSRLLSLALVAFTAASRSVPRGHKTDSLVHALP